MNAQTAIVGLLKIEPECRSFFRRCCESSSLRLRSQAHQWQDELADWGHDFSPVDVEDTLMDLARRFFPESPGAQWDAKWASELSREALKRLTRRFSDLSEDERDRQDLSDQDHHEAAMLAAGKENDSPRFCVALEAWERAGLEAIKRVCERVGAA